jgi:hypothetical protein
MVEDEKKTGKRSKENKFDFIYHILGCCSGNYDKNVDFFLITCVWEG